MDPYSFTIIHKSAVEISHADALSRCPEETAIRRLKEAKEFEVETLRDPVLKYVVLKLQGKESEERPEEAEFRDELAYYDKLIQKKEIYLDRGRLMVRLDESSKVVVPREMRFQVFALAHSHTMAGHSGYQRTWARINGTYMWFRSASQVANLVQSCLVCAKHNTK